MKLFTIVCAAALSAGVLHSTAFAANLADLMNPDDVMLRKPAQQSEAQKKADEAKARADVERRFQEAKARAEAEQRAAEAAAAKKAAEEAAAKKAAEEKRLALEAAAKKAAEEKRLAEEAAAKKAAEEKRLAEEAAAKKAAEEKRLAEEAAAKKAAEEKRLAEDAAAKKAEADAAARKAAEKRAAYLANPDPDERPLKSRKLKPAGGQKDVTETVPSVVVTKKGAKEKGAKEKKKLSGRAAVITADRTDYDRKEGVILFDRNVFVDDEQYKMHADRLFVFLDGTNDLKRLVALGNVSITNESRTASCARAVYTKAASRIVMYGEEAGGRPAMLSDGAKKGQASTVQGKRITYWLDTGAATVEGSVIDVPGMKGGNSPKSLFNIGGGKDE